MSIALSLLRRPYVELDFTRMAFDTRVSFSRSSTGTYFDAAGVMQTAASNVPRKEHNPATGAVRGLLVEEQRTNNSKYSQALDNAAWAKNAVAASATADVYAGIVPYWALTKTTSATSAYVAQNEWVLSVANTTYTTTVALRAGSSAKVSIGIGVIADTAQDPVVWGGAAYTTARIIRGPGSVSNPNGLAIVTGLSSTQDTLVEVTRRYATAGLSSRPFIYPDTSSSTTTGASILATRVQFEAASYASSYIPTTTAAVTRAADVATFTIPPRVVRLVTIYDDGTTSQIAVTPGASYTIPTGQKPILRIRGYFA